MRRIKVFLIRLAGMFPAHKPYMPLSREVYEAIRNKDLTICLIYETARQITIVR